MADFSMFAGDTKILVVSVVDTAGTAVDITGVLIRWQLAKKATDDVALIEKSVGAGITITDGVGGLFEVLLEPADTLPLKGPAFYYEAEIDDASVISTVLTGTVEIKQALIDPVVP